MNIQPSPHFAGRRRNILAVAGLTLVSSALALQAGVLPHHNSQQSAKPVDDSVGNSQSVDPNQSSDQLPGGAKPHPDSPYGSDDSGLPGPIQPGTPVDGKALPKVLGSINNSLNDLQSRYERDTQFLSHKKTLDGGDSVKANLGELYWTVTVKPNDTGFSMSYESGGGFMYVPSTTKVWKLQKDNDGTLTFESGTKAGTTTVTIRPDQVANDPTLSQQYNSLLATADSLRDSLTS